MLPWAYGGREEGREGRWEGGREGERGSGESNTCHVIHVGTHTHVSKGKELGKLEVSTGDDVR